MLGLGRNGRSRAGGPAVGLCWGPRLALAVVEGARDGGWRLRAIHSDTLPDEPEAQVRALARWVSRERLRRCPTVLTLPPGSYTLTQMERPAVPADELAAAARWRMRDLLDYPLEEAVTAVFEVPGQGRAGRPPLVYVVAARAQPLREMAERVRAAGLNLWKIDVAELALRNLVETAETGPETVAGLYLMPERGMLQITRGDLLYLSRSLDYGLDALAGDNRAAIHERVALELQRTMDYYDSHFGAAPVKRLLVMPGGEPAAALAEAVGASLGLKARVWRPDQAAESAANEFPTDALLALGGALNSPGGRA
jgi:MSHA biogenesis protein MshI